MLVNVKLNQYFNSREDFHQLHEENREEHKSNIYIAADIHVVDLRIVTAMICIAVCVCVLV